MEASCNLPTRYSSHPLEVLEHTHRSRQNSWLQYQSEMGQYVVRAHFAHCYFDWWLTVTGSVKHYRHSYPVFTSCFHCKLLAELNCKILGVRNILNSSVVVPPAPPSHSSVTNIKELDVCQRVRFGIISPKKINALVALVHNLYTNTLFKYPRVI